MGHVTARRQGTRRCGSRVIPKHRLLDRVTKRTNPLGQFATFAYDSRDNLAATVDPKLQTVSRTYDDLSRLVQLTTPETMKAPGPPMTQSS